MGRWQRSPGHRLGAVLVSALILAGCGDSSPGAPPDAGPDAGPHTSIRLSPVTLRANPSNRLSYFVTWTTEPAVPTELTVDCDVDYQHTFTGTTARLDHEVFVMGLVAGATCTFTVHPNRDVTGGPRTATAQDVGPLPPGLPTLDVNVVDASRMAPGWTLFSLADANADGDALVVAIDAQGRYRWLYEAGVHYAQPEAEVMPVEQGLLIGNLRTESRIITWEGDELWRVEQRCHHDLGLSPFTAGAVLFPSNRQTPCGTGGVEHSVVELDMDSHTVLWDWWICDHWTPRLDYEGWSHINAVEPVPGERAVLISSRNQDLILKVDRDTDAVLWALGRDGDFALDPADHFLRQHAPEIQPDGTILLLDNGLRQQEATREGLAPREFSRVLQLALSFDTDGAPDRADVVWEYTDPTVFATSRSEADRLSNGNTLMHYCYVWPDRNVVLREVTAAGETVWDVSTPPDTASYRSERFGPYYGHVQ